MSDKKISQLTASTTPLTGAEVLPVVQSGVTKQVSVANLTAGRAVSFASASSTGTLFSSGGSPNSNNGINMWFDTATNTGKIRSYEGGVDWRPQDYNAKTHTFQTNDNDVVQITNDGNIKILVAGKGIDFSADPSAAGMTSELLDDYEEGTWTPALTAAGISGATYSTQSGQYTKIGNRVIISAKVTLSALTSGGTNYLRITGLPFSAAVTGAVTVYSEALTGGTTGRYIVGTFSGTEINFWDIGPDGNATALGLSGARLTATSSFTVTASYSV